MHAKVVADNQLLKQECKVHTPLSVKAGAEIEVKMTLPKGSPFSVVDCPIPQSFTDGKPLISWRFKVRSTEFVPVGQHAYTAAVVVSGAVRAQLAFNLVVTESRPQFDKSLPVTPHPSRRGWLHVKGSSFG
jgi:hypothetical protein